MMKPRKAALLTWSGTCGSCADLLQIVAQHAAGMTGFCYAPSTAPRFFRIDRAGPVLPDAETLPLDTAYEVRLFDASRDIRGRRDGDTWRLAVVSDGSAADAAGDAVASAAKLATSGDAPDCEFRDHRYLLWGRKARADARRNGWTRLTTARIGALWVPHDLEDGCDGIVIAAREYFRTAHDGNVVLAGERLTGLRGIRRGDAQAKEETDHAG
jgi:CRISPR-associated protein (TIGR03984 family)